MVTHNASVVMTQMTIRRDRRLLSKRELWSIAGDAAARQLPAVVPAAEIGHQHPVVAPAAGDKPPGETVPAPSEEHAQQADDAGKVDGQAQTATSAKDEGQKAGTAVPIRRMGGGRPLDAGRVLEVALDPVTKCATHNVVIHALSG